MFFFTFSKRSHHAKWIMKKTIERKYFKKSNRLNKLTVDMMEYMRHLHKNHNEEWPLKRLSQSFNISIAEVNKVLKSSKRIMTNKDIKKHDARVLKRHKTMSDEEIKGPILSRYIHFNDSQSAKWRLEAGETSNSGTNETVRVQPVQYFENIVKDYCDKKKSAKTNNTRVKNDAKKLL